MKSQIKELDDKMKEFTRHVFIRLIKFPAEENGAVMVEFIIVAPLFLFLIVSILQFMAIAHVDALLQYANFMALRSGIVHYELIDIKDKIGMSSEDPQEELTRIMEDAAWRAMGPVAHSIPGYEDIYPEEDRPLPGSPAGIMQSDNKRGLRVKTQMINVSDDCPFLPFWLSSSTEIDVGMAFPFVGRVIEALSLGFDYPKTEDESLEYNMPAFSAPLSGAITAADRHTLSQHRLKYPNMNISWITLKSDAFLDLRESSSEDRWIPWPINKNPGLSERDPQPMVLPIQTRFY